MRAHSQQRCIFWRGKAACCALSIAGSPPRAWKACRKRRLLRSLQIDPNVTFGTLSKGNREKVQLVLVMSRRARLYLLDEPIGGVDPAARDYILETIIRNRDPESTVLISTHLIADIEPVLDAYIFLHGGNVIRSGSMEQVRQEGKSLDQSFREVFRCTQNY